MFFKWKFHEKNCNQNQKWNNNKCRCECKNPKEHNACKKDYIWNSAICSYENGKFLTNIADDSVIPRDEVMEEIKTAPESLMKSQPEKQSFEILLTFFLIATALLIAVSIYCYMINIKY